jgi:cellulose synthase/poly-beta-1,6-N-acetylglucosamine synthase-like glycosyltransferase
VTLLSIAIGCGALLLFAHALFSLSLMLHAWDQPERLKLTAGPDQLRDPELSFTVLMPARGEEAVIGDTIARVWAANYPRELLKIVVICQRDDLATIAAVHREIDALREHPHVGDRFARYVSPRIQLAIYGDPPFNKPHALSVGYAAASDDVIAIFDAEDDVHKDIFRVVNTVILDEDVGVVQGGVQLMNFRDHWFSVFNCLEYFFYFKSKLHFNASAGMVPLGGNTVFIRRDLVERVGGWDTGCLTEDADIGLRLSVAGEPIRVVYDGRWVTREETPHTVRALVKQRTRWHQGFLQILKKGDWRRLPRRRARMLALVTFTQPILDALLLCSVPLIPLALLYLKLPVAVALLSFAPLYAVILQMLANVAGIVVFGRTFDEPVPWRMLVRMPFTYLPYEWLIAFSALRATVREIYGNGDWEKTEHRGAHRLPRPTVPQPTVPQPAVLSEPLTAIREVG